MLTIQPVDRRLAVSRNPKNLDAVIGVVVCLCQHQLLDRKRKLSYLRSFELGLEHRLLYTRGIALENLDQAAVFLCIRYVIEDQRVEAILGRRRAAYLAMGDLLHLGR